MSNQTNTTETQSTKEKLFTTKSMVLMALFAAVTCILGPLALPIGPVPISLTNFVIYFSLYILGWKRGTITCLIYLVLGAIGLPVFSGFAGGLGKIAGPTGGYIIGFIFLAIIAGLFIEKTNNIIVKIVGMILATAVDYAFGTAWFCFSTGTGVVAALSLCVFPFIIGDLVKIVVSAIVAPTVAKQIKSIQ